MDYPSTRTHVSHHITTSHHNTRTHTDQRLGVGVRGEKCALQDIEVHGLVLRQGLLEAQPKVDGHLVFLGGWGPGWVWV